MSSGPNNFNALAAHYRWLEFIIFGYSLERCRYSLINRLSKAERVLIIGEGDGRFLSKLVNRFPGIKVDCIEGSSLMIARARSRLPNEADVNFLHVNALDWEYPFKKYDAIVTCFFLDCFKERTLREWMPKIVSSLGDNGEWLVAEFRELNGGVRGLASYVLIKIMYCFFRRITNLEASSLPDWPAIFRANGLSQSEVCENESSMINFTIWRWKNARKIADFVG